MKLYRFLTLTILFIFISTFPELQAQPKKTKKGANIALTFHSLEKDTLQTSYFNLGFLTNIYTLRGIGLNAISSVVKNNVYGAQLSGLANIAGRNMQGLQAAGISNITGYNASGMIASGLVNLIGNEAKGLLFTGGINISGNSTKGLAIGGLMNLGGKNSSGVLLSGLANVNGENTKGIALSGLMNISGKDLYGVQISSIINIDGRETKGIQLCGIGNVGVKTTGFQLAGLSNIVADELKGVQLSGAVNVAMKAKKAAQISTLTNICLEKMQGAQISIGNYATEIHGTQIGFLNLCAGKVKGIQIGIINHSKDTSTVKIGLVNVNPKTRIQMLIFGGNATKFNLAARFLNKHIYTMLGFGTHYLELNEKFSGSLFYRAGLDYCIIKNLHISGDIGYAHIENFKNKDVDIPDRMYSLQARINLEYHPLNKLGIFVSGGYGVTRYYNQNKMFEKKPIIEAGIILF